MCVENCLLVLGRRAKLGSACLWGKQAVFRARTKTLRRGKNRGRALETWLRAQPVRQGGLDSELMSAD